MTSLKYLAGISGACMLVLVMYSQQAQCADRKLTNTEIKTLVTIYAPAGYGPGYLKKIFSDPRVRYVPKLARMLVVPPDFSAHYERFTKKNEVNKARAFRRYWRTCLGTAADTFGVDPNIIVAILLVETSLGENRGRSPVLSVFATLLLDGSLHRDAFIQSLSNNTRREHYLKRLDEKSAWARNELQALLVMNKENLIDVCALKGSYAGAFGIPQFLPTSYIRWAHSGTEKRPPNLFYMPHAIMSVGNFLKEHGWKKSLSTKEKRNVIWNYNRSSAYVDTVLTIAEKIAPDKVTQ